MSNVVSRYFGKVAGNAKGVADQIKYNRQASQNNADADAMRYANKFPKNAAKLDASGNPTDAFKARSVGDAAKDSFVARTKGLASRYPSKAGAKVK